MLPYGQLIQYYHITRKPVNQAICIFITVPILFFCSLVSIKCTIIVLLLLLLLLYTFLYMWVCVWMCTSV